MKPRLILVSLGLAMLTVFSFSLQANDRPKTAVQDDEIITSEQQLRRQFDDFTAALLQLQLRLSRGTAEERERAKVLEKVLEECKNLAINQKFTQMIELMRAARVNGPNDLPKLQAQSDRIADDLRRILDLLQDTSGTKLSNDVKTLKEIISKIEQAIAKERTVQALTEQKKTDNKELQGIQDKVAKDTKKIEKDIQNFLDKDKKDGKAGEGAPTKGENKDAGKDSTGAKGEAKDAGKNPQSEGSKGNPKDAGPTDPKNASPNKGETKPGQDSKSGQPNKSGGDPKANSKPGNQDPKDGKPDANAKGDPSKGDMNDKGANKDNKNDAGAKNDKKNEGGSKDSGKTGDPMKDSPQGSAKGDPKDSKSGADSKPQQGSPDAKSKAGGGDPMGGGGDQKPPVASKEPKGADKGGEGKSGGEAKGGDGKQGEAKSGAAAGQGQAKDGGASPMGGGGSPPPADAKGDGSPPPPPSAQNPKNKDNDEIAKTQQKIKEAGYDLQKATEEIAKERTEDALKKQADAIAKMEDAKKKLEKLLQQLREEEIERVLAALQARCEKMLMLQKQVLQGTKETEAAILKHPDKKPTRADKVASQGLSDKEKEIILEANKCITIIEAEGTAVAFPEVFQSLRTDMITVQKRLDLADVHDITQGIQVDIITTLEEMIKALKEEREKNQDPGDGKPGDSKPGGKQPDPKLLKLVQELKMVRAMQKRVNDRTELYGKRYTGEQANEPLIIRELRTLSDRQRRIQEIVRQIANGENK
ncbi:MAG: hypothetical protein FJ303_05850 [Planctomycetes bacterium]|nr:hypothetical protein [Planctomycetota bacterium]